MLTIAYLLRPGGVTAFQVAPASFVSWTKPFVVPTQISPAATGDGAKAVDRIPIRRRQRLVRLARARLLRLRGRGQRLLVLFLVFRSVARSQRQVRTNLRPVFPGIDASSAEYCVPS